MVLCPWVHQRFYAADGVTPLASGKVYTYSAGTDTAKATYKYYNGTAHANPIVLDSTGCPATSGMIFLDTGSYKIVVKTSADVTIASYDNITGNLSSTTPATLTALKALTGLTDGLAVYMLGYAAYNDGGGGWFVWDSDSAATADNGMVVLSDSTGTGRWLRMREGNEINVKWYGAKLDGTTDDSAAIQGALDYASTNTLGVFVPEGTAICTALSSLTNVKLRGQGKHLATLKHKANATADQFSGTAILEVCDMTIDGNQANQAASTTIGSFAVGTTATIHDCIFKNTVKAGVKSDVAACRVTVRDCEFQAMKEHGGSATQTTMGIYLTGADASVVTVENCRFAQAAASSSLGKAPGGVYAHGASVEVYVRNCRFEYIGQNDTDTVGCVDIDGGAKVEITGNTFSGYEFAPVYLTDSNNVLVADNLITTPRAVGAGDAIIVKYGDGAAVMQNIDISRNRLLAFGDYDISGIYAEGTATYGIYNLKISGNTVVSALTGIEVIYPRNAEISHNYIYGAATAKGILLTNFRNYSGDAMPYGINVVGGVIANLKYGIYADTGTTYMALAVSGVQFQRLVTNSVYVSGLASLSVVGCNIIDSGNMAIASCTYANVQGNTANYAGAVTESGCTTFVYNGNSWQLPDYSTLVMKEGTDNLLFGDSTSATEGMKIVVSDSTYDLAGVSKVKVMDLDTNKIILYVQMNNDTAIDKGATDGIYIAFGSEADPDKYAITAALTANAKSTIVAPAIIAVQADLYVGMIDASANWETVTTGTVRVRVVYLDCNDLANA